MDQEDKVRLEAANLLLQRGIRFKVDAPFFSRLFGRNYVTISPMYPGTIAAFSALILEHGLDKCTRKEALEKLGIICKVIAIAILNNEKKIAGKDVDIMAKRLLWKIPASQLLAIYGQLENINGVMDFTIITSLFTRQMNQMMTARLGQTESGS